jgi:hypothetical protein
LSFRDANITRTNLLTTSSGNVTNGGNIFTTGVLGGNLTTISDTNITSNATGHADGTFSLNLAHGVLSLNKSNITNTSIATSTSGNSSNGGNIQSNGVQGNANTLISGSTITSIATGNADGANSRNQANGALIFFADTTIISSSVNATTSGMGTNGGIISSVGIYSPLTLTFLGNTSSMITAKSTSGSSTAVFPGTVNNNSIPKSQCSTDGVTYHNCP